MESERAPASSAPGFEVTIKGTKYDQSHGTGVHSLILEDHVDMVDHVTLRMGGGENQPGWSRFAVGDDVSAKIGAAESDYFQGQIISLEPSFQVEGTSAMNIRCMDKTHILGRGRKTRFFENMKDSDVVQQVGAEAGISVNAEATDETHPYILQRNESNLTFLKRLAARNNYMLRVEQGKLRFHKAQFSGSVYTIKMGDNLRSMRYSYNTNDMVQKVVVRGWDINKKEAIVGIATTGDIDKIGGGELGADKSGMFGDSTAYITDVPVFSQGAANLLAKAEINRIARGFLRGSMIIQGNEKVRANTIVTIEGVQAGFNGEVFVVATRHVISEREGYTTEVQFCSTSLGT